MEEISRPLPRGTSPTGVQTWDGAELSAYRRSLGVRQGDVAARLAMSQSAISLIYEGRRAPVRLRADRVGLYLNAVERCAAANERETEQARAELAAIRAARADA